MIIIVNKSYTKYIYCFYSKVCTEPFTTKIRVISYSKTLIKNAMDKCTKPNITHPFNYLKQLIKT